MCICMQEYMCIGICICKFMSICDLFAYVYNHVRAITSYVYNHVRAITSYVYNHVRAITSYVYNHVRAITSYVYNHVRAITSYVWECRYGSICVYPFTHGIAYMFVCMYRVRICMYSCVCICMCLFTIL